jgi:hypothetical protein
MASTEDVLVTIGTSLDEAGFKKLDTELKKVGVNLEKTSDDGKLSLQKINTETKKTGQSFVEFGAKVGAAYMALKSMIDASIKQRKADIQLNLAIKNNTTEYSRQGLSIAQLTKKLKDYAGARENATGIDDAATQQQLKLLLSMGVMPDQVERVTTALQDMAAGTDISVETMARAWGKLNESPEEALGALSRAGIKIRKEHLEGMSVEQQRIFILDKLEGAFKGQAAAMFEASGDVGKASVAIDNAMESVGDAIMPAIGAVASVVADIANAFNKLPAPVRGAILAIGGAITMFLTGPIGMVAGAIVALGGLITMFKRTTVDLGQVDQNTKALTDSMKKMESSMSNAEKKTRNLLDRLKSAKEGSDDYKNIAQEIINTNPHLANSNITVANSYTDIANAAMKAMDATDKADLLTKYDTTLGDMKKMVKAYNAVYDDYKKSEGDERTRLGIRLKALRERLSLAYVEAKQAAEILGLSNDFQVKIYEEIGAPGFESTAKSTGGGFKHQLRRQEIDREWYNREDQGNKIKRRNEEYKNKPVKQFDYVKKNDTTSYVSDKTPYDSTALMRQLETLKNIKEYGEQAGNLINKLTDVNNRYNDTVKEINESTHKSGSDKQKALKAAAELKNEEISIIQKAANESLAAADRERKINKERDEFNRKKLEMTKLAQDELSKVNDDELKAMALLDFQLKNGVINQQQYDAQKTTITKKYANERLKIESKLKDDIKALNEKRIAEEKQAEQDRLKQIEDKKKKELRAERLRNVELRELLYNLDMKLIDDEFAARRAALDKYYEDQLKTINESSQNLIDKIKLILKLLKVYNKEKEKIDKDETEKKKNDAKKEEEEAERKRQERIQAANEAMNIIASGFDAATATIEGRWEEMVGYFLSSIPGIGNALSSVFGASLSFFETLFDSLIETSAEKLEREFNEAMSKIESRAKALERKELLADGEVSADLVKTRREKLQKDKADIANALGLDPNMSATEIDEYINKTIDNARAKFNALPAFFQDSTRESFEKRIATWEDYLAQLFKITDELDDIRPVEAVQSYLDQIQDIQDLVDIGEMSQEDAIQKQIDLYDQAISALEGVAGAEKLLLSLKKEKYNLEKGITAESQKQLLTAEQIARNAKIQALEDDIKYGRSKNDYAANKELSDLYVQQLASMAASGLVGTDIYRSFEDKLRDLTIGNVGTAGYQALSGSGSNVNLGMTERRTPAPIIRVDGGSSSTANTYLNANLNLPPDLVNWLLRSVNSQGSRSF